MGLSITSSSPKGTGINAGGLTGNSPQNALPGEFLALLTSELGNLFLSPDAGTIQVPDGTTAKADDKGLPVEVIEPLNPQIDPGLLAALSAASTAIQNKDLDSALPPLSLSGDISLTPNSETRAAGAERQIDTAQILGLTPFASHKTPIPATDATATATAIQSQSTEMTATDQKKFGFDTKTSAPAYQPMSPEALKAATESQTAQPLQIDPSVLTNTATTALSHNHYSKQAGNIETNVPAHIQEKLWPQQFGEKMVWMAKADIQTAQININPPELGPIQITLNLSGDQAKLAFSSPHLEVRQSIESALPQLKEMLSSNGISLGQTNIGANLQQPPRETVFQNTNEKRSADENAILSSNEVTTATGSSTGIQRQRGLVDLFA